jgi:class 3 adenylate cyclase
VNTAARVEGLTKKARQPVLMTESTREALLNPPTDLAFVDEFDVRGRESTIRFWTLAQAQGARFGARAIASVSDGPQTPW